MKADNHTLGLIVSALPLMSDNLLHHVARKCRGVKTQNRYQALAVLATEVLPMLTQRQATRLAAECVSLVVEQKRK